jgi:Tol biopolymer transport system component
MKKLFILLPLLFIITGCENSTETDNFIPISNVKTIDTEPDWSHNGKYIAYVHFAQDSVEEEYGSVQIRVLNIDSTKSNFLTNGYTPRWSPDDKFIAYETNGNIYKINVETKVIYQLTSWGNCFFPSWSPDGQKIAFDSNQYDPKGANAIWIMNADGTGKIDISEHGTGEWREPNWSPDGNKILYSRFIGIGTPELFLMDTSGQNQFRLTYNNKEDWYTDWSKDGNKIAWYSVGNGNDLGIWTMNKDGSNAKLLLKGASHPSWSPDGKEIAYYDIDSTRNVGTVWILDVWNGTKKQLFNYPK